MVVVVVVVPLVVVVVEVAACVVVVDGVVGVMAPGVTTPAYTAPGLCGKPHQSAVNCHCPFWKL